MTDRTPQAAVAAGSAGVRGGLHAPASLDRRGRPRDLRCPRLLDLPARRGSGRARLRGRRGRRRAVPRRQPLPVVDRHRRLGRLLTDAARDRGRGRRPPPRSRRRRAERLRPERDHGRPAARRGRRRSACFRCSTVRRMPGSRSQEMELLGLFATQAAIALALLASARKAQAALAGDGQAAAVAGLAGALDGLEGDARDDRRGAPTQSRRPAPAAALEPPKRVRAPRIAGLSPQKSNLFAGYARR